MKRIASLLCLLIMLVSWQKREKKTLTNESVAAETNKIYNKLVKIRRDFHVNPELAGNENRTQEFIKQYLLNLGIEVKTDNYGHSVVGILNGGKKGKKIAWRADMDALSNDFPDEVEFKSKIKGVQHSCGHDVHLAVGLGIAEILAKRKEFLKGTVYFIFQPEEETFTGAKGMIENGLFSSIQPDEIYSLHITNLPVGKIMVKPNEVFAYQKRIRIALKNELSKEEVKKLANRIQSTLTRSKPDSKHWEIQHMSDPEIGLMNTNTVFNNYLIMDGNFKIRSEKDMLFLEAYLYETNRSHLQSIIPEIEQLIKNERYADKLISVSYIQENPTVFNNEKLTKRAIKILTGIYGNDLVMPDYGQIPYFNDDFAYFQQKVPGVYFLLGGSNIKSGIVAMNHAPNFKVDEESIKIGVRSFSSLIINKINNK